MGALGADRGGGELLPKGSLRGRPGVLVVAFDAPVETRGFAMETKEALMEQVRERITALLEPGAIAKTGNPATR